MVKWLLLFALGYVAYRWLVRLPVSGKARETTGFDEPMVECTACGIYFPQSEAVVRDGKSFCSDQHSASWQQQH